MTNRTALYVGAEPGIEAPLRDLLRERDGIGLAIARTGAEAIELVTNTEIDCVVTEYELPERTGLELLTTLREEQPDVACILYADPREPLQAGQLDSIVEFVPKTHDASLHRLAQLIQTTIDHRSQRSYPVPPDEDERLATVDQYAFDNQRLLAALERIVELAVLSCSATSAFLNLVQDHTVSPVVCYEAEQRAYDRGATLCTYTILEEGPTVVEDVRRDPRVETADAVDAGDVRFYAGVPLMGQETHPIGTLCVIRPEPGTLSEQGRRALGLLAADAMDWIEQHTRYSEEPVRRPTLGETG